MWSSLALLTDRVSHLPPLMSVGLVLTICGLVGAVRIRQWKVSPLTWLVGIGGIFGYHSLLFTAFANAPAVEANMIQYLWPLFIVLFTPIFIPDNSLNRFHILGAIMGLSGAILVITGGNFSLQLDYLYGYSCAFGAAVIWACYSLLTKRLPLFSTAAVGGFCLVSGILSLLLQFSIQGTFPPLTNQDWTNILLLGIGPMGLAFYTWDAAMKKGDSRTIGSMAYMTPLLSTLLLVLVNDSPFTYSHGLAIILVSGGAITSSLKTAKRSKAAHLQEENLSKGVVLKH